MDADKNRSFLADQGDHGLRDPGLSRERWMYVAGAAGKLDQQAGGATVTAGRDVRRKEGREGVGNLHIESAGHLSENAIQRDEPVHLRRVVIVHREGRDGYDGSGVTRCADASADDG